MKRMIDNAEALEKLAKEIVYNKETNTIDVGGNVYVDGHLQFKEFWRDAENEDNFIIYLEMDNTDGVFVYAIIDGESYYGVGYIYENSGNFIAFYDGSDQGGNFSFDKDSRTGQLQYTFTGFINVNEGQFKIYEHQLTIGTAATTFYLQYYSIENLVIDSLQDLTAVVKPNADTKLGVGSTYIKYENNVWKLESGDLITSVSDNVVVVD